MVYNTLAHLEKGIDFLFGYVFLVASALCQQWLATFVFCVDFLNNDSLQCEHIVRRRVRRRKRQEIICQ